MRMTQPIKLFAMILVLVPTVQADLTGDLDSFEIEIENIRQQTNSMENTTQALSLYGAFRSIFKVERDGAYSTFDVPGGVTSLKNQAMNMILAHQLANIEPVHVEYFTSDFYVGDVVNTLPAGFRYDFEATL